MRVLRICEHFEKTTMCENCGAEIGYYPVDIEIKQRTDYTGHTDNYNTITCPNCKKILCVV